MEAPADNVIADLLDDLVENVLVKERKQKHLSTATLYRCDDPSVIAIAYSYKEMLRIVEDYRSRPDNNFYHATNTFSDLIGPGTKSIILSELY